MTIKPIVAAIAVVASFSSFAQTELTVVNFGGANGDAQKKAYFGPYEKSSGNKIVGVAYNEDQGHGRVQEGQLGRGGSGVPRCDTRLRRRPV